ncbi:MAG: M23 family metallopeptidase [Paenibacillaceae bacterium]|nr:M23 family metallopeptidase [Paenibacillaceae bacterium]
MNDQTKEKRKEEAPQSTERAQTAATGGSWKRLLSRKWAFPAIYMVAAALILTFMWVYQQYGTRGTSGSSVTSELNKTSKTVTDATTKNGGALPAATTAETMRWPVKDAAEVQTMLTHYDSSATAEAKEAAMVEYGDTFIPHAGIDLARKDNQTFDVLAALSGKVTHIEKHPLNGNVVEITHDNGLVTVYQSLDEVKVTQGATVKQGDAIAKAGRNELEKEDGVHVHFEVRQGQDGPAVNPEQFLAAK